MQLPKMAKVKQIFSQPEIRDIPSKIIEELKQKNLKNRVNPGQRIAVTAGSRGIANIDLILKTVVDELKAVKAEPFVLTAMGSHGGATPEGQIQVLNSLKHQIPGVKRSKHQHNGDCMHPFLLKHQIGGPMSNPGSVKRRPKQVPTKENPTVPGKRQVRLGKTADPKHCQPNPPEKELRSSANSVALQYKYRKNQHHDG